MHEQVVILRIKFDPSEADPPEAWNWPELLEVGDQDVEVVMTGVVLDS